MPENSKKLWEQEISTRMKDNSLLDQKRSFSLIWMHIIAQLQYCLKENSEAFDQKKYLEELEKINTQIELGQKIIEDIENDIKDWENLQMKIPNEIFELKWSIQYRLDELQKSKKKLDEFLSKVPLIAEYKKDTDRYTNEILEIIDIIK